MHPIVQAIIEHHLSPVQGLILHTISALGPVPESPSKVLMEATGIGDRRTLVAALKTLRNKRLVKIRNGVISQNEHWDFSTENYRENSHSLIYPPMGGSIPPIGGSASSAYADALRESVLMDAGLKMSIGKPSETNPLFVATSQCRFPRNVQTTITAWNDWIDACMGADDSEVDAETGAKLRACARWAVINGNNPNADREWFNRKLWPKWRDRKQRRKPALKVVA